MKFWVYVQDKEARFIIEEYCKLHDFQFETMSVHPNHYQVAATKGGTKFIASFSIGEENRIIWNQFSLVDQHRRKFSKVVPANIQNTNTPSEHINAM
ncbi:hypothetical protein [Neptunitalea lumnitzerae]|nr:hypothetical protein [Neptunitalea sp. Y10]